MTAAVTLVRVLWFSGSPVQSNPVESPSLLLFLQFCQISLGQKSRYGTVGSGGSQLPDGLGSNVASGKDAGNVGFAIFPCDNMAAGVKRDILAV